MPPLRDRLLAREVHAAIAENRAEDGLSPPPLLDCLVSAEEAAKTADAQAADLAERYPGEVVVDDVGCGFTPEASENPALAPAGGGFPEDCEPSRGWRWGAPQLLGAEVLPEPYPLEALPEGIRAAVTEVQEATQAPLALVAGTALTALSIACQGHIDVARREDLVGGTGLYILTIADSGERKSACDKIFLREVRAYERAQRRGGEAEEKRYQAEKAAWETKQIGIKEKLRERARAQ